MVGGITVTNQAYGHATSWDPSYNDYQGILGLGASVTAYGSANTWLTNVTPQLKKPYMGVNLVSAGASTFSFGYDEVAHENGVPCWNTADVSHNSWYLTVSSFHTPTGDVSSSCLLDTGTTALKVPLSVSNGYWAQVPNASINPSTGQYSFPCPTQPTLPDLHVTIGGDDYVIPGQYNYFNDGAGTCYSRVQSSSGCIFGQPFFYGTYAIFNNNSPKSIGLTPRK